jgi:hypothetical protein
LVGSLIILFFEADPTLLNRDGLNRSILEQLLAEVLKNEFQTNYASASLI